MARWQPLLPYILIVAAALMAWAMWRVYGPRITGSGRVHGSTWLQGMLWLATVFLGLAFFANDLQWLLIDPTPEALR